MATQAEQLGEILHSLGGIEAEVKALRRDVDTLRESGETCEEKASESRARTHQRLDELARLTATLETDVKLVTAVAAQARDASSHAATEVIHHAEKLDRHIKVVMPIVRKVRRLEWRVTLFISGLTLVAGGVWYLITSNLGGIWKLIQAFLTRIPPT